MDFYRQNIIDHYKRPRNKGKIADADYVVHEVNTLCGDALKFYIKLNEAKDLIEEVRFEGEGCAISQASGSILTEELKGAKFSELEDLISGESILEMLGIEVGPARMKCAMLSREALKKVLE
jgi:nitrogen fixation NifU-like protein